MLIYFFPGVHPWGKMMTKDLLVLPEFSDDYLGSLIRRINEHIGCAARDSFDTVLADVKGSSCDENLSDASDESSLPDDGVRSLSGEDNYHVERAAQILDKYGNSILRMAYSYLHNMSDAEDILQDTLIQYIKTKPGINDDSHEKAWLLKVCANLSKNKIKYNKLRETDELLEEIIGSEEEDLQFVWEAVKKLPPKYSEVIHLFYQEGYSTKDISAILSRNEVTVRSDLNRARKQLKNILKEAYDYE